jgi:hypothetical protein
MNIPNELIVVTGAYATDGGSISILAREPHGTRHAIVLWQHMFVENFDPKKMPGRLYFDNTLLEVRSDRENMLIAALKNAKFESITPQKQAKAKDTREAIFGQDIKDYMNKIEEGPDAALAHLIDQLIEYVESYDYVELAERLG